MTGRLSHAKLYYFLAMREVLLESSDQFFSVSMVHNWILQKHPNVISGAVRILKSDVLFRICIQDFIKQGWVDSIDDEFASLFVRKNDSLVAAPSSNPELEKLQNKYESLGLSRESWLGTALTSVLDRFDIDELNSILIDINSNQEAETEDRNNKEEDSWSPIPLDRSDQQQTQAIEALDHVIEELRGANGYTSTNPEEKTYVQDSLSLVAKRLREDGQISWMYLSEFAFKPLATLIIRFGKASLGITAAAAKEAIKDWLKKKGVNFLDNF